MRDIFHHPKLRLQPRIVVQTLADKISAKAVIDQDREEERENPFSPFDRLQRRTNHQNQKWNGGQNIARFRSRKHANFKNIEKKYGAAQDESARCGVAEVASSQD